jgi:hypothetical protein
MLQESRSAPAVVGVLAPMEGQKDRRCGTCTLTSQPYGNPRAGRISRFWIIAAHVIYSNPSMTRLVLYVSGGGIIMISGTSWRLRGLR